MELIKRDPHACINPVDPTVSAKPLDANNLPQDRICDGNDVDVYVEDFWRLPTKGFRGKVHIMTTIDKDEIRRERVAERDEDGKKQTAKHQIPNCAANIHATLPRRRNAEIPRSGKHYWHCKEACGILR